MGMPAHNDMKSCCPGIAVKLLKIMQNVEDSRRGFGDCGRRQGFCPSPLVSIPSYGYQRSQGLQGIENLWFPHISRMNDQVGPLQRAQRFLPQQAVGVRDEPNAIYGQGDFSSGSPGSNLRISRGSTRARFTDNPQWR